MATGKSGSFNITVSSSNGITGKISWSETYDANANTSSVTATLYYSKSNTGYQTWSDSFSFYLTINGNRKNVTVAHTFPAGGESNWAAMSYTVNGISHNNDGSKSITIGGGGGDSGTSGLNSSSGSSTVTLTTIPRAASISSVSNINAGNAVTVKWTPKSSSHTFKVEMLSGDTVIHSATGVSPARTTEYTYTGLSFSLNDLSSYLTNAISKDFTIRLTTYNGSTQIGSASTKNFTVSVPSNIIPTLGGVKSSIVNISPFTNVNERVQNYTKMRFVVDSTNKAQGIYGSTIVKFEITGYFTVDVNASTVSGGYGFDYTTQNVVSAQTGTCSVVAVDSRGRKSAAISVNLGTFYPYYQPTINRFIASRSVYDDPNLGKKLTSVTIYGDWQIYDVNGKVSLASGYPKVQYKLTSASSWTNLLSNLSLRTNVVVDDIVPEQTTYDFRIIVRDSVGTETIADSSLGTIKVLFHARPQNKGGAFGKMAETDDLFEIDYNVKANKDVIVEDASGNNRNLLDLAHPVGSVYMSDDSTDPSDIFGGTWQQIQDPPSWVQYAWKRGS